MTFFAPINIIAKNTYNEIIRDRILYGIAVFGVLLMGFSVILGELSFTEQSRIALNFGFTGIHISSAVLAIFVGSTIVYREVEKQTVLTLLTRPLSRTQFLLGKYFGLIAIIITVLIGLAAVLAIVAFFIGVSFHYSFLYAVLGVLFEALVLVSLAIFFGSFAKPITTVIFTVGVFLVGHWLNSLAYFAEKTSFSLISILYSLLKYMVPNLETFNWRAAPIYNLDVTLQEVSFAAIYMIGWVTLLLSLSGWIFSRKDFV